MRSARPASRYGLAALFGAVCGCLLTLTYMPGLGSNPAPEVHGPSGATSSNDQSTRAPVGSNNYVATNANAISGRYAEAPYSTPIPPDYSTLAPVVPITQTAHGYTLTLYPMYASANLIVLTYTVQLPPEGQMQSSRPCGPVLGEESPCGDRSVQPTSTALVDEYEPRLTSKSGFSFPWLRHHSSDFPHARFSAPVVFDAQHLAVDSRGEARLRLELNVAYASEPLPHGGARVHWIKGPFTFDFTIAVDPARRVAEVNQTITEADVQVTIERVVATRYDVRIDWHAKEDIEANHLGLRSFYECCSMVLKVGEKSVRFLNQYIWSGQTDGTNFAAGSFMNAESIWEITAWHFSTYTGARYYPPRLGPVFRFVLPPASD
jgi:hypothetical protein